MKVTVWQNCILANNKNFKKLLQILTFRIKRIIEKRNLQHIILAVLNDKCY